jgi:hypothetical protein
MLERLSTCLDNLHSRQLFGLAPGAAPDLYQEGVRLSFPVTDFLRFSPRLETSHFGHYPQYTVHDHPHFLQLLQLTECHFILI